MSNVRTIEKIFREAYHVGESYECFKILIVGEYGSDFSASHQENNTTFREHLHGRYFHWILDAFESAAGELDLSLGQIDSAEFFAYYNYYWCNTRRTEIPSGEKIDPTVYLTRLVDGLGAGLILSAGGVGDERFRREDLITHGAEFFERPIFVDAYGNSDTLKEIFKRYITLCRTGIDEMFDHLAEQIAEGNSPFDIFDEICDDEDDLNGSGGGTFNTFPMGRPSGLHPDLLVVCEDPMNLAEPFGIYHPRFRDWYAGAFNYIDWWCHETRGMFPARRVKLLTDKWTTDAYKRYKDSFRRLAKRDGVKFEFYLYTLGAKPAKINLPF